MIFQKTPFAGLFIITLEPRLDERGSFTRLFCQHELRKQKVSFDIAQINTSKTKKRGMIRGMHYQAKPYEEGKIVRCLQGKIYDVVLDLRPKSKTYGKWFSYTLDSAKDEALCIPKGFAHGFQTLTKDCEVLYLMSEFYAPESACGIRWDDPFFNITWPISPPLISKKDTLWLDWRKHA